jgi:hypothetical protein
MESKGFAGYIRPGSHLQNREDMCVDFVHTSLGEEEE